MWIECLLTHSGCCLHHVCLTVSFWSATCLASLFHSRCCLSFLPQKVLLSFSFADKFGFVFGIGFWCMCVCLFCCCCWFLLVFSLDVYTSVCAANILAVSQSKTTVNTPRISCTHLFFFFSFPSKPHVKPAIVIQLFFCFGTFLLFFFFFLLFS